MISAAFPAAFAATVVEVLESAVIVYAIVRGGYPKQALAGAVAAALLWFALAPFGISLTMLLPVALLRVGAALAMLILGLLWLREAWPRQTQAAAAAPTEGPETVPAKAAGGGAALLLSFKVVAVEGAEVALVLLPLGAATGAWIQVGAGAVAALITVVLLAAMLHGQLQRLPERRIRFAAGLLCAGLGALLLVQYFAR